MTRHLTAALVLLGAALALLGAAPAWVSQSYGADGSGELARNGYELSSAPVALSLAALAGLGAGFAVRGVVVRVIGVLIALTGVGLVIAAGSVLTSPPPHAGDPDIVLPVGAELLGPVQVHSWAIILTALGGLCWVIGGLWGVVRPRGSGLGSRYDSPARVKAAPTADVVDADSAAQWWKSLDAGEDPTRSVDRW